MTLSRGTLWLPATILLLGAGVAEGRTLHVRESTPAAETIIRGRHAEYVVRFDGPVDHAAAHMQITQAGHVVQSLVPLADSAPDVLFASAEVPPPGAYHLHWQVTSPEDGVTTEGDIPFSVAQ
jgi:methionine-rich copper-binding protein CopC